jgi:hypothetical protein
MALGGIGSNKSGTATGTFVATTSSVGTTTRTWDSFFTSARLPSNVDLILHVRQSGSNPGRIYAAPTESVARPIFNLITENAVLKGVVKNLWKVYRYNQEYQSFLLGGCSEEDFLAVAEKFADAFDDIPEGQLVFSSSLLLNLLDGPLTSDDLSVLVNTDPYHIEQALSSSSNVQRIDT